ncbi:MAG: DsbA family protein [bacterium]
MEEKQNEPTTRPTKQQSFFGGIAPKASFFFGLLSGVAAMSIIGFIITAVIVVNGKSLSIADNNTNGAVAGATAPSDTNTAAAEPTGNPNALRAVGSDDHTQGTKNAKVTLIEFSDFQCPYCQTAYTTLQQVMKDYSGKVQLVYRHFPLESIHPNARPAANASECIANLGGNDAFWKFAENAYANQSSLGDDFYKQEAAKLGINAKKFSDCYTSKQYDSTTQKDIDEGTAAGVQGTPSTFINGTMISGALPYASFKQAIDAALAK